MKKYRYAAVTCVRWDDDRITEWLDYYQSIGFEHIYIYSNDDEPTALYQKLLPYINREDPFVTFHYYRALGMQRWTLIHCLENHRNEFEWIGQFDVDEYLSLRSTATIDELVQVLPEADSIYFNWVFFGNSNHLQRMPNLLLNYTTRQDGLDRHTRTITRSDAIRVDLLRADSFQGNGVAFYHGWKGRIGEGMRCINVLGHDMSKYYDDFEADAKYIEEHKESLFAVAVHHHYAFQAESDFDRRFARGTAGEHAAQPQWSSLSSTNRANFLSNISAVEDLTLAKYWKHYLSSAWEQTVLPEPDSPNLAMGRPCRQSSVTFGGTESAWQAVDGKLGYKPAFETDAQKTSPVDPFWDVDLGEVRPIHKIIVFNRLDDPEKCAVNIRIMAAKYGEDWEIILTKNDDEAFGGVDGKPLIFCPTQPVTARFIRIAAIDHIVFGLSQVEIY